MPSTISEVLDEARQLLEGRLAQLSEERRRVERALAELGGKPSRRRPGRPRRAKAARQHSAAPRKRGKRRAGTRAEEAAALIAKRPGIGASEVAKTMKINPNYVYRVLGDLEKEGRVQKDGRQYFPVATSGA